MPHTPIQALRESLTTLTARSRRAAIREATRRAIAPLGPALRDDLGLTRQRQSITFQNDKHKKHSFD